MLVLFAAVGLVLVLVIAAVAIGRESQRLAAQAPRPVFDLAEALPWVAERLPFDVSAVLSYEDVERILRWHLDHVDQIESGDADGQAPGMPPPPFSVVGEQEALEAVLARAASGGFDYTPAQVKAVLEAELAYLQLIGAIGPGESAIPPEHSGTGGSAGDTMSVPEKGGGPAEQTL